MESTSPYLIIGLGNPGPEYRQTRHNVGFMLVDRLAEHLKIKFSRVESRALVTKGEHLGRRIVLAKPQTYMNLSGQAAGSLARFYKIPIENLLIVYDEVDLPLGTLRMRPDGGSAGHKGMASIIDRLGTQSLPRLRIGVGRPPGRMDASDYVLQRFSAGEQDLLLQTLDRGADAALMFVTEGLNAAMNRYNGSI